jgi:hypothetical protein
MELLYSSSLTRRQAAAETERRGARERRNPAGEVKGEDGKSTGQLLVELTDSCEACKVEKCSCRSLQSLFTMQIS